MMNPDLDGYTKPVITGKYTEKHKKTTTFWKPKECQNRNRS